MLLNISFQFRFVSFFSSFLLCSILFGTCTFFSVLRYISFFMSRCRSDNITFAQPNYSSIAFVLHVCCVCVCLGYVFECFVCGKVNGGVAYGTCRFACVSASCIKTFAHINCKSHPFQPKKKQEKKKSEQQQVSFRRENSVVMHFPNNLFV